MYLCKNKKNSCTIPIEYENYFEHLIDIIGNYIEPKSKNVKSSFLSNWTQWFESYNFILFDIIIN